MNEPVKAIVRISDTMVFIIDYDPEHTLTSYIRVKDEITGDTVNFVPTLE